jgi:hypothetical protein
VAPGFGPGTYRVAFRYGFTSEPDTPRPYLVVSPTFDVRP